LPRLPRCRSRAATSVAAGEEKVKLKEGAGLDKVRANCVACHSLDYIPLNSPFLDEKGWESREALRQALRAKGRRPRAMRSIDFAQSRPRRLR
jgi:mono/diheme cytochrome c family protein